MGALLGGNADRQWGYKIGDKVVPPSIDRIDGGGPGRSGPTFEGGGLLSDIGNALMRPYGYRDRMQAVRPQMRPTGLLSAPAAPPPAPAPAAPPPAPAPAAPALTFGNTPVGSLPAAPRYVGPPPGVLPLDYAPPEPPFMSPELEAELRARGMTDTQLMGYAEAPRLVQLMELALKEGRLEDYLR